MNDMQIESLRGHSSRGAHLSLVVRDAAEPLVAEVFYVSPEGEVDGTPLRAMRVVAGLPCAISLARGQVLVVREAGDPRGVAAAQGGT